jgi:hypothetical protein
MIGRTSAISMAAEAQRNHLLAFAVVAASGQVGHADEFTLHDRFGELQGRRDHCSQCIGIGPVGDDEELTVVEATPAGRIAMGVVCAKQGDQAGRLA